MPDGTNATPRTFTEGEAYALVDQAVGRETAALVTEREDLQAQLAAKDSALEVMETEKNAALQRAEKAEADFEAFKTDLAEKAAREAKRGERIAALKEANPFLEATEDRANRIVAMSEEDFNAYLADMRELASRAGNAETAKAGELPHQSAAFASTTDHTDGAKPPSVLGLLTARGQLTQRTLQEA